MSDGPAARGTAVIKPRRRHPAHPAQIDDGELGPVSVDKRVLDHGIDSFTHQAADRFRISRSTSSSATRRRQRLISSDSACSAANRSGSAAARASRSFVNQQPSDD